MIVSIFSPHTLADGRRVPGFVPTRWDTTWAEFADTLRASSEVPADPSNKLAALAISMGDFAGTRAKANVVGCDWLAFDFDDKTGESPLAWKFDDLVAFMDAKMVPFIVHTTSSCRENAHCLRLLFPLDRVVTADEFPVVWASFYRYLRSVADEQTKDASRVFFEPRAWAGAYNRFHSGADHQPPVTVDVIVKKHRPPQPERERFDMLSVKLAKLSAGEGWTATDELTDIDNSPIISERAIADALASPKGGRMYKFLCSVAVTARRKRYILTERDLETIAERMAFRLGRRDGDLRHDVYNAMRFAAQVSLEADAERITNFRTTVKKHW